MKAFHKVDLALLLRKVRVLGIKGALGRGLVHFLTGRTQAVRVGEGLSAWADVISGVPQGSVLGPLLFLIFIADLGEGLPSGSPTMLLKYVDDSKAIQQIKTPEDVEALQCSLDSLYRWQQTNNMMWNGAKFVAIRMGPKTEIREETQLFTPGFEDPIAVKDSTRDLGVIIDSNMDFRPQRLAVAKKVRAKTAWALRTFRSRAPEIMRTLWRSVVQPHQDYASQLWSPADLQGDIAIQESPL